MELIESRTREIEGRIRIEGDVLYADGMREVLWFDFPASLASGINHTGDPWVVALAPLAMTLKERLVVPLPADAKLVEGLRRACRAWHYWEDTRGELDLEVPMEHRAPAPGATRVGSLFSGGVDSWHTVLDNNQEAEAGRVPPLDTLLLVWGADISLNRPDAFQSLRARLRSVARELSCELIDVATNLRDTRWQTTDWPRLSHGCLFISLVHASGAFRRLLIPSSVTYSHATGWGSHPITDALLSSRSLEVVYDAAELSRVGKMPLLCSSSLALESLRVCWRSGTDQNCGRCLKCLRTMLLLELYGGLERCPTFPSRRVDLDLLRHIRCVKPADYRMLRTLGNESFRRGRPDIGKALEAASDRSARLDLAAGMLTKLDSIGIRGATRLRTWLERGNIYN